MSLDNLIVTRDKGISEGVSSIFIENMNKLSLHERPMHCTDMKRETLYIKYDHDKDDGWAQDEENKNLKEAISKVTHYQRQNLDKWIKEHPNWENNSGEQAEYMRLVKSCTEDCKEDKDIILNSDGKSIRNFCYIADFIVGFFHVLFKGKTGEVYNVSNEDEHSIKYIANLLVNKIFKKKFLKVVYKKQKIPYVRANFKRSTCSNKKVRLLGWKLKFNIEQGMYRTIESYF